MFTEEQQAAFNKELETVTLDDLYTPEPPELSMPKWLHPAIQKEVNSRLQFIKNLKDSSCRLYIDMYPVMVESFERIKRIFFDPIMESVWDDLCNTSIELAVRFSMEITLYENRYDGALRLVEKQKAEITSCKKMIKKAEQLYEVMEEYHHHYYGHMIQDNHFEIMNLLRHFKEATIVSLSEFQAEPMDGSKLFSSHWPTTRKCIGERGLAIFFIRKIYYFFLTELGKPMYNNIAKIIEVVFGICFDENHVMKHCAIVKSLLSEDSIN